MKITLASYKAKGDWQDKLIRLWTRSKYSHSELIIDGKWYSSSHRDGKVRCRYIESKPNHWDFIELEASNEQINLMVSFLNSQLGKKYDWLGIFLSQVIPLKIQDPNRWFCSEICSKALMVGKILNTNKHPQWYSPGRLFNVIKE